MSIESRDSLVPMHCQSCPKLGSIAAELFLIGREKTRLTEFVNADNDEIFEDCLEKTRLAFPTLPDHLRIASAKSEAASIIGSDSSARNLLAIGRELLRLDGAAVDSNNHLLEVLESCVQAGSCESSNSIK